MPGVNLIVVLPLVLAIALLFILIDRKRLIDRQHFESQYLSFLSLLISELRSGHGFNEAILSVRQYLRPSSKLVAEIARFNHQLVEGRPSAEAIREFCAGKHPDLVLFRVAVLLTLEQGAAVIPCLVRLKKFTKQRQSYRSRIRSALAAQKLSTIGIIASMVLILLMQFAGNSDFAEIVFNNKLGQMLIILSSMLIFGGCLWMFVLCRSRI